MSDILNSTLTVVNFMQINSAESHTIRGEEVKVIMMWMLVMSTSVFLEYWQHFNFLGTLHRMLLKLRKFKPATQLHPAEAWEN